MAADTVSRRKLPTTLWIDIGIIVLGVYLFVLTLDYPGMSGTFSRLVLIMIGVVTAVDLIQILRKKKQPRETTPSAAACSPPDPNARPHYDKVFYLAVLMPVYYIFLRLLGVILGSFIFVCISGWILGYRKKINLLVASAIVTAAVYLIFVVIMDTFLPQTVLMDLIRG
jgi:hypothetical protein